MPQEPAGITVAGVVPGYRPVTREELLNPPAEDWLMLRGNYAAHNYSELNQINRGNIKNLRLVWSWAMNDTGTQQPSPLIHDGIMYLNNTGNILQALNAATGDLIWEHRYGTNANAAADARDLAL